MGDPWPLGEGDFEVNDGVAGPLKVPHREALELSVAGKERVASGVSLQEAVMLTSEVANPLIDGGAETVAPPRGEPEGVSVLVPDFAAETVGGMLTDGDRVLQSVAVRIVVEVPKSERDGVLEYELMADPDALVISDRDGSRDAVSLGEAEVDVVLEGDLEEECKVDSEPEGEGV